MPVPAGLNLSDDPTSHSFAATRGAVAPYSIVMGAPLVLQSSTTYWQPGDQFSYQSDLGDPCPLLNVGQYYFIRRKIADDRFTISETQSGPEIAFAAVQFVMSPTGTVRVNWTGHGRIVGDPVVFVGDAPPSVVPYAYAYVTVVVDANTIEIGDGVSALRYPAATFTIANPGVVTATNHGLQVGQFVRFGSTGTLPTPLVAGTAYRVHAVTGASTFTVSSGGAALQFTGSPSGSASFSVDPRARDGFGSGGFEPSSQVIPMWRSTTRGLYSPSTASQTVQMSNGDVVTFANMPAGRVIPIRTRTIETSELVLGLQ
jgi:hypothetical protein